MSSAFIHFIGLVTFVTASSNGPHILIPRFDFISAENNVIRIPTAAIASDGGWPKATGSPEGVTDFFIGERTITIGGAGGFSPNAALSMPHLTCCCPAMKEGLSPDYDDPDPARTNKKAAYIPLPHGAMYQYPSGAAVHLDLEVVPVNGQITITGARHNTTHTIVVNVPANREEHIIFRNSPPDDTTTEHADHWKSYYKMGNNANAVDCAAMPSNDQDCGFRSSGCLTTGAPAKAKKATAAHMKRLKRIHDGCKFCLYGIGGDINCSSSSWP